MYIINEEEFKKKFKTSLQLIQANNRTFQMLQRLPLIDDSIIQAVIICPSTKKFDLFST